MKIQESFYDIYDYCYPPWWTQTWAQLLVSAGVLLLIVCIVFFLIKKKKRKQLPWEWAESQLKKLSLQGCKNKDEFKLFYYTLTTVLKRYFQLRFFWPTEDKTDEELICFLQGKNFDRVLLELVKNILSGALWIKFANEDAIKSQAQEDLAKATTIIEKTKPNKT